MKKESYKLFDEKWEIEYVDSIPVNDKYDFLFGESNGIDRKIKVATKYSDDTPLDNITIDISRIHEIVHSIFTAGQYMRENNDEPLIEWVAKCIYSLLRQGILSCDKFVANRKE